MRPQCDEAPMTRRRALLLRLTVLVLPVVSLVFFAGCGALGGDQNTFSPSGDVAQKQKDLFLLVLWPAAIIGLLVFGALVYIVVRYRRRSADDPLPKQIHGNDRLE